MRASIKELVVGAGIAGASMLFGVECANSQPFEHPAIDAVPLGVIAAGDCKIGRVEPDSAVMAGLALGALGVAAYTIKTSQKWQQGTT